MKMTDLVNEAVPVAPQSTGTNTAGTPTTQQAGATTATQQAANQQGTGMDPASAQQQKELQKKTLAVQLKAAQDAVKSAQENVKAIQAQMAAIR